MSAARRSVSLVWFHSPPGRRLPPGLAAAEPGAKASPETVAGFIRDDLRQVASLEADLPDGRGYPTADQLATDLLVAVASGRRSRTRKQTAGGWTRRPCPPLLPPRPSAGGAGRRARFHQPLDRREGVGNARSMSLES
jgi:hypothetical protein